MPVFSSGLEEKKTFAKDDMLLIGDSEANDTTRKIKVGTLLAGAGAGGGAPKHKTGDVVVRTDYNKGTYKVISWEEYESNSSEYPDAIGLVVDPQKRTFIYRELVYKLFANSDGVEILDNASSFEDGIETFERIAMLQRYGNAGSASDNFPVFYHFRGVANLNGSIFYCREKSCYVPALHEWQIVHRSLMDNIFYDAAGGYVSKLDILIGRSTGSPVVSNSFIPRDKYGMPRIFYSQTATIGKTLIIGNNTKYIHYPFSLGADVPNWTNADENCDVCPIFGLYTEDEE
jgi:hypothetical protein